MTASIAALPIGNLPIGTLTIAQAAANLSQEPFSFPPGTYTFTPPKSGYWKFVGWGAGVGTSSGSDTGASGAYGEITRFLTAAQPVTIVVGVSVSTGVGTSTTFTFADGLVATAGANGSGGVASGFDVNLNGSAGVANASGLSPAAGSGTGGGVSGGANGGAGAPGNLPYRGGRGGASGAPVGLNPGGGAGQSTVNTVGGDGLALVVFIRP